MGRRAAESKEGTPVPAMMAITPEIEALVDRALEEDLAGNDVTTRALIPPEMTGRAVVMSREQGILAGVDVAAAVFQRVDPGISVELLRRDGSPLEPEAFVMEVSGAVASVLTAERTAVNFMQRLSGIATETGRYVREVAGHRARVLDTRKTTPGLRALEKYAVAVGGGTNHRHNLGDGVLVKDNHIEALGRQGLGFGEIVERAKANAPHSLRVEIEVETPEQAREALEAGADILLLDNMSSEEMSRVVDMCRGQALTEASGGVGLHNVKEIASTGVDMISVGALTHSSRALDFSLELVAVD